MVGTSGGGKTNTSCLVEAGAGVRQTISLQMCGNGIVEQDEECDPGEGVTSPCCDSTTCKFINGAVCDPDSSICCTSQCTFSPSTQVCRPSVDTLCDYAETCTGNSSSCPSDTFAPNGWLSFPLFSLVLSSNIKKSFPKGNLAAAMISSVRAVIARQWQLNARPLVLRWVSRKPARTHLPDPVRSLVKTLRIRTNVSFFLDCS